MSGKVMWLASSLWLLAPWLAAQPQEKKTPAPEEQERQLFQNEQRLMQGYILQQAEHQAALAQAESPQFRMNEDIEVLRRILDDTIRRLSGPSLSGGGKAHGNGTFEDVTKKVGLGKGVAMGDFDTDGNLDLFVANQTGSGVAFLDYDKDGWLDLCVVMQNQAIPLYRNPGDGTFERVRIAAPAEAHGIFNIEAVEGTYLKGYGVVYSVSLPVVYQESVKESAKPAPKPLSQWERVRKELRGEKVEGEAKASPSREETLADAILKVLADNGHHFSDLAENERISVALTLRASFWDQNCAKCHAEPVGVGVADHWKRSNMGPIMGGAGMGPKGMAGGGMGPLMRQKMPEFELRWTGGQASKPSGAKPGTAELVSPEVQKLQEEAQNQALLGDLHLKQERYKDAVAAYRKAVDAYQKAVDTKRLKEEDLRLQGILPAPDTKSDLKDAERYLKLGQAYQAAGQEQELRGVLQKVREAAQALEKSAQAAQEGTKPSGGTSKERASVLLPSKLILSAPKKLMDQMAAGKISLDDFKKAASVEYVSFPHAKQKCAPKAGEPGKATNPADKKPH